MALDGKRYLRQAVPYRVAIGLDDAFRGNYLGYPTLGTTIAFEPLDIADTVKKYTTKGLCDGRGEGSQNLIEAGFRNHLFGLAVRTVSRRFY